MTDLLAQIQEAITTAVGISVNATLSAISGSRHVLPPTYADAPYKHNMTEPNAQGVAAWVSIDSPASFANRIEDQLRRADLGLDPLRVEVAGSTLSTMQMPHRAFDAILRDSLLDGTPFRKTDIGRSIIEASPEEAAALLRYDPAMLLLGGWDSTGLGRKTNDTSKWAASLSVEIYGTNAVLVKRAGYRLDPLHMKGDAQDLVEEDDGTWRIVSSPADEALPAKTAQTKDRFPRRVSLSEIVHGNTLSLEPKGVLVDQITLAGALSLTRLRRYHFGNDPAQNLSGRTALALMGVYGIAAVIEDGLDLRRDCELVADEVAWTIRGTDRREPLHVTKQDALAALNLALAEIDLAAPILLKATDSMEQRATRNS